MQWNPQQSSALDRVAEWRRRRDRPFFYLAGYAGTGKTTLARHFAESVDGHVAFAAFTGKAASVMRGKGCPGATTIHRLIYTPTGKSGRRLQQLRADLAAAEERDYPASALCHIRSRIQDEIESLKAPNFELNEDADIRDASLVIIDECSMVDGRMADDLLGFGVPVLVLGDPAQLPPVYGGGFFTSGEPDAMLTEVHRQARESGVLRLATEIREGRDPGYCDYGDAEVIRRDAVVPERVPEYDQVIVGRNRTRHATNKRMRELLGRVNPLPESGDRLLCLRNNHDLGLFNGEIYYARTDAVPGGATATFSIQPEDDRSSVTWIEAWTSPFLGERLECWSLDSDVQEFGYGYVLTCHKAQGSQYDSVIVFDESRYFRKDARRWLYTAATRAARTLTIVR